MHLAILPHADKPILSHSHQFALGVFHQLAKRIYCLVPFPVRQEGFYTLQLRLGRAVGAIDLHAFGQLELRAGPGNQLGLGQRAKNGRHCH